MSDHPHSQEDAFGSPPAATTLRFYFDTDDGKTAIEDDEGIELDGLEAARIQAQSALADLGRDAVPGVTALRGPRPFASGMRVATPSYERRSSSWSSLGRSKGKPLKSGFTSCLPARHAPKTPVYGNTSLSWGAPSLGGANPPLPKVQIR